ncbi:TonB-dependent receptor [Luteimonas saliphila]|uniref:TonB-dependent receptor n=1 Tax=Luteimonas saliphila TaxID=2804919 RepID=UPI00192D4CE7|nr:TonB-dependent receptor [Luteimonas saliphila]
MSAIALASVQAQAQDAPQAAAEDATELDRVRVTGIRSAIEKSIDTKQTSTSIVEAISAEDIGKLPDSSIAESIARLPGLTAQRERGRATQINIRGFAGDFSTATLNGREQASTGDNRGVEFDQYPSELLSQVVVYKTPDAALVGQGLSGTVDLQTVRPLSFDERVMSVNARYDQNRIRDQKENGYRLSATYIDQFADDRVGLMLAVSKMDSPQPGFQNEVWGFTDGPDGTTVLGGGKLYRFDNNHERTGVAATLQFKPNDLYEGTLDWFYSKFEKTEIKTGMEFGTIWGTGILQPGYTVAGNNTITDSTWNNVHPVIRMDSNPIDDTLNSIGFNNKFHIGESWLLNADISTSDVEREFRVLETYAGVSTNGGATTLDVSLDPGRQFYNYVLGATFDDPGTLVLTDAGGWGQDGYLKDFTIEDKIDSVRLNAIRNFDDGFFRNIDFGANYTKRTKEKSSLEAKLCLTDCTGGMYGVTAPFPGGIQDFNFGGIGRLGVFDANDVLNSGIYNLVGNFHQDIAAKNWSVDEELSTLYFKAGVDTDLGSMPLRGNVGFQKIYIDQSSEGYSTFTGNPAGTPVSDGISYSVFLPSLNLGLEFLPETVVRLGLGRQMARPRMDQMRAGMDVSIDNARSEWTATGGNPRLRPWLADAVDVSVEKYFTTEAGNRGYLGAAWFHKDLKTYIYTQDVAFDFAGFPLPPPVDGQVTYPDSTIGRINQPFNGEGGTIRGIELTASLPLDVLWKPLDGLGLIATYSDTSSSIHPNGPGSSEPLSGLSKYVSNATLYYERGGFSIRYSRRTRSDFRGETRGFGADYQTISIAGETVQDAQLNYSFNQGALQGLSLYLQVSNIGDEPFAAYNDGDPENRPERYFEYGRTTLAGFSYKF